MSKEQKSNREKKKPKQDKGGESCRLPLRHYLQASKAAKK